MPASKRSQDIATAFDRMLRTGDKSNIENIKYNELETTIFQYQNPIDKNKGFYKAMEARLQELKELKTETKDNKSKQKDLLFRLLIGIIVTVIGSLLFYVITKIYF